MSDVLTPTQRSFNMSRIRGKDTAPEMVVRRLVWSMGYRYRLHGPGLPGRPDLVLKSRKVAIFVNGCFWHRHHCPRGRSTPSTRAEFWRAKFEANRQRDRRNLRRLRAMGWTVLVIWECQTTDSPALVNRIVCVLGAPHAKTPLLSQNRERPKRRRLVEASDQRYRARLPPRYARQRVHQRRH